MATAKTKRSELPLLESALLWAMRAWVIGRHRNIQIPQLHSVFASLNAAEAVLWLEGFMEDLQSGARRMLNVDCVCQPDVNADEVLLLDVLGLVQEAYADESQALLGRVLQGRAAESACVHALGLIRCLNAAGHYLPRGPDSVRRHAFCHLLSLRQPVIPDSLMH